MNLSCFKIFLFSILVTVLTVSAQTVKAPDRPRLIMKSADVFNKVGEGDSEIYKLTGNVQFVQGDAYINCSRANYSKFNQTAVFYGPVSIFDGKRTLTADRVNYNGILHSEEAFGNVVLISKGHKLTSEFLKYDQDAETAQAEKNVIIYDLVEQITLSGNSGFYRRTDEYGRLEGNAQMTKIDSLSGDTLNVSGRLVEAWGDSSIVTVSDSVEIERGKMRAICNSLNFMADRDSMDLNEDPIVWQENQKMTGETISLLLDELELKKGWIRGNGRIESTDSTNQDIMTGKLIALTVESDSLRRIVVKGQATSVYHVTDDEEGVNSFSGDEIKMVFHGEKLHRLIVESTPGLSKGEFKPDKHIETVQPDSTVLKSGNSK